MKMHFPDPHGVQKAQPISFCLKGSNQSQPHIHHQISQHQNLQARQYRTQAKMFNLTHILTYLRVPTPTTYEVSRDHSVPVRKESPSKYLMLFLIAVTAMVFFHISEYRELKERDQRQQDRLAALEIDIIGIQGKLLPKSGCPELDDDDDFKLPPPAYELHEWIS